MRLCTIYPWTLATVDFLTVCYHGFAEESGSVWFSASVCISSMNVHICIVALGRDDTSEVSNFFSSLSHFGSHQRVVWKCTNWIFSDSI